MKLALAVAAALLAFGASRASSAAEAPLSWTAPAACPDEARVREALALSAGDEHAGAGVSIVVEARGELWHAHVVMPSGERELTGETCEALAEAVVVIVSLANEERAPAVVTPESVPPSPAPRQPDRAPAAAPDVAPATNRARWPARGLQLSAALLGEVGLLPGPSAGPRLALGVSDGRWALELAGGLLVPRRAELATAAVSADIRWLGAELLVCRSSRALLRWCGGGEIGELSGTGAGVDRPETAHGLWLAFVGMAALRAPLGTLPLSWEAGVAAASALRRPEFGFDEIGVLHRAGQLSGRAWLGLGWN